MKKGLLTGGLVVVALFVSIGFAVFPPSGEAVQPAMAELSVEKMTCGSCVATIRSALEDLGGVEQVDIFVTTGRSQVLYNPDKLDAKTIAETITASGYPAVVKLELDHDEYSALQSEQSRLAERYLAKIGTRLVPRSLLDDRLQQALASMPGSRTDQEIQQLRTSLWQELQQRQLLLNAAEQNQVVVPEAEVELRIDQLRRATPNFEAALAGYGGEEPFVRQLQEEMIINRMIELHVVDGIDNTQDRRSAINSWYRTLVEETPVTIYDPQLQQTAAASTSSCGGGCCS